MTRYIFVTGGVVSSLGKGLASAALGALLQARGYRVRLRKFDPYLNVDPGTMSPFQHGEVYVTDDGAETDLDLGHYERFTGVPARRSDSVTAGQIYQTVIARERRGDYLGGTVQVIPHVTDAIKEAIVRDSDGADFVLVEIGGTVGDIEGLPFFESIRQFAYEQGRDRVMFVHLTLVPHIETAGELKTKPTQHSVKELRSIGIAPDLLLCRANRPIPPAECAKIALFCNVREDCVISATDVKTIYEVPLSYHAEGFDTQVMRYFGIQDGPAPDLSAWEEIVRRTRSPEGEVAIAVVGKYTGLRDAYKSLFEALAHGGVANSVRVDTRWIEADDIEEGGTDGALESVHGVLVPGGFGERGVPGKIAAVEYARTRGVPYFGICFGMQLAVIETARSVAGIAGAGSTEFGPLRGPGYRAHDRMEPGRPGRAAQRGRQSRRDHAARRLRGRARGRQPGAIDLRQGADFRAPPAPLRGEQRLPRATGRGGHARRRPLPRRGTGRNRRAPGSSLVRGCPVPPRAHLAPLPAASALRLLHRGGGEAGAAGVRVM